MACNRLTSFSSCNSGRIAMTMTETFTAMAHCGASSAVHCIVCRTICTS
jgi:hypothetical protein